MSDRAERIDAGLAEDAAAFLTESVNAANRFVDALETAEADPTDDLTKAIERHTKELNKHLNTTLTGFASAAERRLEQQFDGLATEVRQIETEPSSRVVMAVDPNVELGRARVEIAGPAGQPRRQGGKRLGSPLAA